MEPRGAQQHVLTDFTVNALVCAVVIGTRVSFTANSIFFNEVISIPGTNTVAKNTFMFCSSKGARIQPKQITEVSRPLKQTYSHDHRMTT